MHLPPGLWLAIGLGLVLALAVVAAKRAGRPSAIVLVLAGVLLAVIPGAPTVRLDPDLVLLLMLPPLIYSSGVGMSWRGFRNNLRPILLLAIGCVLATASAVAAAVHYLFDIPWMVGFVLGAVVSPPDAVAPMAILRTAGVPQRILIILEGEGLVNDATALTLFAFAVEAVADGHFAFGTALGSFALTVVGEIAWGLALAAGMLRLRRWSRDAEVEIILGLLTPFIAFWPPHALGGSGVLAAVAAGLYVSWNGARYIIPATRLQGFFVWGLTVSVIEGLVFLLSGLQAHIVLDALKGDGWRRLVEAGLLTAAVVIVVRFIWVFPATYLPRWLIPFLRNNDPPPGLAVPFIISFAGLRGGVSLVAALSIPLMAGAAPFPERDLILFAAFCVIFATLVGEGLTLPPVIRWLGLATAGKLEAETLKARELAARVKGIDAAIVRLDGLVQCGDIPPAVAASVRRYQRDRRSHFNDTADPDIPGSPAAEYAELSHALIDAERKALNASYRAAEIDDGARRRIERELDLEEARLRHVTESATGERDDPAMAGPD